MKIFPLGQAPSSIRTRLLLMTAGIVLMVVVLLSAVTAWQSVNLLERESRRELHQSLELMTGILNSFVDVRRANLDLWQGNPLVTFMADEPHLSSVFLPSLRGFFQKIREQEPWIGNILILKKGERLYSHSDFDLWEAAAERERFLEILRETEPDVPAPVMLPFSEGGAEKRLVLLFKKPILKQGAAIEETFLVLLVDPEATARSLFGGTRIGSRGFVTLGFETQNSGFVPLIPEPVSGEKALSGSVIAAFAAAARTWAGPGQIPDRTEGLLMDHLRLKDLPFWLIGAAAVEDINGPVRRLLLNLGIIGAITLLFGIGAAVFFSGRLAGPVRELTDKVQGYTSAWRRSKRGRAGAVLYSEFFPEPPPERRPADSRDELAVLTRSFQLMAAEIHDLFEQSRAYARELEAHGAQLENLVAERTEELARANADLLKAKEAAETATQAKSVFLANMSHELRTPLNAILGFTQLMARDRDLPADHRETLGIILKSGEHLLSLINDVLDLSKIEAGRIRLKESDFDLAGLMGEIREMFRLRSLEKGIEFQVETDPELPQYIRADEGRLRQILLNLVSNAMKFTEAGGITIRVQPAQGPAEPEETFPIFFEVQDTGPGIPAQEMENLFRAFVQTSSGENARQGTGLGLAISRKFAQMMGGGMTVESEPGKGTIFRFHIRAGRGEKAAAKEQTPRRQVIGLAPDQPGYRILVVDDRPVNRQLMIKLLTPIGFEVREAENGKAAMEIWEAWAPHLIWMDMRMPVMDGYEATRQIKATAKGQATAVIALTASAFDEERVIVLSAGCDDFVRKPFREAEIFDMMEKHLGVRYRYESGGGADARDGADQVPERLTSGRLKALPRAVRDDLEDALRRVNMARIAAAVAEIRKADDGLAELIGKMVDDFEYSAILQRIEEMKEER